MSLDLHEIRERALPTRDGFYHVVGAYRVMREDDFDALIAEVERLRGINADLRLMVDGLETAAHEERAAVVAWLRSESFVMAFRSKRNLGRRLADVAADAIERGEHRREEER